MEGSLASFNNVETDSRAHSNDKINSEPLSDVAELACSLRDEHINRARQHAKDSIRQALQAQSSYNRAHRLKPSLLRCTEQALNSIPDFCSSSNFAPTATFHPVSGPNRYISWVPLSGYLIHDLDEPYLVYLGDSESERERAEELYDRMSRDYEIVTGKTLYPQSDGEIDENGQFRLTPPSSLGRDSLRSCDRLGAIRMRAAQRHAIYTIVTRFGSDQKIFGVLSNALCLGSPRRAILFYDIACTRRAGEERRRVLLSKLHAYTNEIERVLITPKESTEDDTRVLGHMIDRHLLSNMVQNPNAIRHFCRTCMLFACGLHDDANTIPRKPIPDPLRDKRVSRLSERLAEPCSMQCFLNSEFSGAGELKEASSWKSNEINLLRKSVSIFEFDPCSLAVVLGTRTCHEVHAKLMDPAERYWADAIIKIAREPAHSDEACNSLKLSKYNRPTHDEVAHKSSGLPGSYRARAVKSRRSDPVKMNHGVSLAANGEQFIELPGCDHPGACTRENKCPCVEESIYCKSLCRCNAIRYSYNERTGYIETVGQDCLQTADYCNCIGGKCDTSSCTCRRYHVACTPGGCKCDAHLLPSQVKPRDRLCKNCDFIVGRHKRTFIGNSKIDGLGLFAGEKFERGEIVGVYWGSQWDADHLYLATVLGDEMNRTYSFEMTDTKTIDATALGSKARFVNHGKTPSKCNCDSAIWHVRGKPYICIYTTRSVRPGEEFLFDYKLIAPASNDWRARFN